MFLRKKYTDFEIVQNISRSTNCIVQRKKHLDEVYIENKKSINVIVFLLTLLIVGATVLVYFYRMIYMLPLGLIVILGLIIADYCEHNLNLKIENDEIIIKLGWIKHFIKVDKIAGMNIVTYSSPERNGHHHNETKLKLKYYNHKNKRRSVEIPIRYSATHSYIFSSKQVVMNGDDLQIFCNNFITKKSIIKSISSFTKEKYEKYMNEIVKPRIDLYRELYIGNFNLSEELDLYIDMPCENPILHFNSIDDIECEKVQENMLGMYTAINWNGEIYQICDLVLKDDLEKYENKLLRRKVTDTMFLSSQLGSNNYIEVWVKQ